MNDNINEHLTAGPVPLSIELSPGMRDQIQPEQLAFVRTQLVHLDSLGKTPATGDTIYLAKPDLQLVVMQRHWALHQGYSHVLLYLALASEIKDPYQALPG